MANCPKIVVIGGGTAGITVAAQLCKLFSKPDVTVIEPAEHHYYQPLWTLVGGGIFSKQRSKRNMVELIPDKAKWLKTKVTEFNPDQNFIVTADQKTVAYDYLVVCPGIQIDWHKIKGLADVLGTSGVCSNYSYDYVEYTWECIRSFNGGNAIFTMPSTPVKCAGAPQKIMYLAEDYFAGAKIRERCNLIFASATPSIFAVKKYADALEKVVQRKKIKTLFRHELIEVQTAPNQAVFNHLDNGQIIKLDFDLLHVTPPMSAPDFIKQSSLASKDGWVDVDKQTLQHVRYPNVFSLGDASSLPTSKTGAAIRKEAPVLIKNLLAHWQNKPLGDVYNGYTSCPLVTGYGKLILAEFDYDKNPMETFPFDQSKERYSMYLLKKYGLPAMYWHGMLKGKM